MPVTRPLESASDEVARSVYERDGFVGLRRFLSPESVNDLRRNIARYEKSYSGVIPEDWIRYEEDGSTRGMYFLERVDPYFGEFGRRADLRRLVETITGCAAEFASMETFHKQPRIGSPSLFHQDGIYYVGRPTRAVNIWIAIDHATKENAALQYWPGTHKSGYLVPHASSPDDPHFRWVPDADKNFGEPTFVIAEPGDLLLHSDLVLHGSSGNTSARPRLSLVMTFTISATPDLPAVQFAPREAL